MLNQFRPGTILALMAVVMGIMYWLIFAVCNNVANKMNPGGNFGKAFWLYVVLGLVLPIVGVLGGIVNVYKDKVGDERPFWIMMIGVILVLGSLFIDVLMIVDVFSGGGIHDQVAD